MNSSIDNQGENIQSTKAISDLKIGLIIGPSFIDCPLVTLLFPYLTLRESVNMNLIINQVGPLRSGMISSPAGSDNSLLMICSQVLAVLCPVNHITSHSLVLLFKSLVTVNTHIKETGNGIFTFKQLRTRSVALNILLTMS